MKTILITPIKLKTRKEYMNKECTHREYYADFVSDPLKVSVMLYFSKAQLTEAFQEDKNLNSIPLGNWDGLGHMILNSGLGLSKIAKEKGDSLTMGVMVCICKEAARQIIED